MKAVIPLVHLFLISILLYACATAHSEAYATIDVDVSELNNNVKKTNESINQLIGILIELHKSATNSANKYTALNRVLALELRFGKVQDDLKDLRKLVSELLKQYNAKDAQLKRKEKDILYNKIDGLQDEIIRLQNTIIEKNEEILRLKGALSNTLNFSFNPSVASKGVKSAPLYVLRPNESIVGSLENDLAVQGADINYALLTQRKPDGKQVKYYLVINGKEYGPYEDFRGMEVETFENGEFYFTYYTKSSTTRPEKAYSSYININDIVYGPFDNIQRVQYINRYRFCFIYTNNNKEWLYISGAPSEGSRAYISSLAMTTSHVAYSYTDDYNSYYLSINNQISGPYKTVSTSQTDDKNFYVMYTDQHNDTYFQINTNTYGPFTENRYNMNRFTFLKKKDWYSYDPLQSAMKGPFHHPTFITNNARFGIPDEPGLQDIRIDDIPVFSHDGYTEIALNSTSNRYGFYYHANTEKYLKTAQSTYGPFYDIRGFFEDDTGTSFVYASKPNTQHISDAVYYHNGNRDVLDQINVYEFYTYEYFGGKNNENILIALPFTNSIVINGQLLRGETGFNFEYNKTINAFNWLDLDGRTIVLKEYKI